MPYKFKSPRNFLTVVSRMEGKWPNWDPERKVEVGDYGILDKDTGLFERQGNVYKNPTILNDIPELSNYQPRVQDGVTDHFEVTARATKSGGVTAEANGAIGSTSAGFKGEWTFNREAGGVFVMNNIRLMSMPRDTGDDLVTKLIRHPSLINMRLVTDVWTCAGYARYLSNGGGDSMSLKLTGNAPILTVPAIGAGGELSGHWEADCGSGVYKYADPRTGPHHYTGLFVLKKPQRRIVWWSRGGVQEAPRFGVDQLEIAELPWDSDDEDSEDEKMSEGEYETLSTMCSAGPEMVLERTSCGLC